MNGVPEVRPIRVGLVVIGQQREVPMIDADIISRPKADKLDPTIFYTEVLQECFLETGICNLLEDQLERKFTGISPRAVVISFEHVTFLGPSALGKIIRFRNEISGGRDLPSKVYLSNINTEVMEVFRITPGLRKHFNIFDTKERALEAARESNPNQPPRYDI